MREDITREFEELRALGQAREFICARDRADQQINLRGKRVYDFSNWDYLRINENPSFKRAAIQEIELNGVGARSARLLSGTTEAHTNCEMRLAKFFASEDALLFSSRNQAFFTLFTSLLNERDTVFVDASAINAVADACYLVGAGSHTVSVDDLSELEETFTKPRSPGNAYLVLETINTLDGVARDVLAIKELAQRHGIKVVLDESLAAGAIGVRGAGCNEASASIAPAFCIIATLGHGLAGSGAAVCGSLALCAVLRSRSRTFSHEVAPPPALCTAIVRAIEICEVSVGSRDHLALLSSTLRHALNESIVINPTPLVVVKIDSALLAKSLLEGLFSRSFFAEHLDSPSFLSSHHSIRFIVNIFHSPETIEALGHTFLELRQRLSER